MFGGTISVFEVNLFFAGSEEGRHYIYWSIPLYREWNYFSMAGGKATVKKWI